MARWCLRLDKALNDNECYNKGCTDEWGTHHSCKECLHNKYMGDNNTILPKDETINLMNWIESIKERVDNFDDGYKVGFSAAKHNQWKPSEEQIKVCKKVYADILSAKGFGLDTVNDELNRLEEELKKLKA